MRAVIPVAGVGTRLRPHTYTLPKVLLNVAGKPILGHILDELRRQGIKKASIITGYMGKLIQEYVNTKYSDMDVDFVPQKESLGLGHAIWVGNDTYDDNEPLLIILGDTIFDVHLHDIITSEYSTIGIKKVEDPRRRKRQYLQFCRKAGNFRIRQRNSRNLFHQKSENAERIARRTYHKRHPHTQRISTD